jgi:hypothetical protein
MFGLFGKSEMQNTSFNNALIASIGESVRKNGRFPTEDELFSTIGSLAKGQKLSQSQVNSVRSCALEINNFSWAETELMPLIRGMQKEMPTGGRVNYDKIIDILSRHVIITTDEALEFMKKYGLN